MADTKITGLQPPQPGYAIVPSTDVLPIVVIADPGMAASGSTRKATVNQILGAGGTATLASATITGDLAVKTTGLTVNSSGVGIGLTAALGAGNIQIGAGKYLGYSASAYITPEDNVQGARFKADNILIDGNTSTKWNIGGTSAMTLNSTGLGVGVAPSSAKLEVNGAGRFSGFGVNSIGLNTTGTAQNFVRYTTAGADCYIGTESSVAGGFFTGSTAYATCIYNASNTPIQFFTNGSVKATIDASGNLLVGVTSTSTPGVGNTTAGGSLNANGAAFFSHASSQALYLNTNVDGQIVSIRRSNVAVGSISVTTTGTTFNSLSDYRLKESVAPLSGGLARISALKPSIYKWKSDGSSGEGFLAHELAEVVPSAVTGDKDAVDADGKPTYQGIDLSKLVPILVAAIQELTARVQTLEAK